MKTPQQILNARYSRQILFAAIGEAGQARIAKGRVLLVGCGGLGSVLADILVRAGVGFLRIVDRDFVSESNLQRQVLFDTKDVEDRLPKAEAARRRLAAINPHVEVDSVISEMNPATLDTLTDDIDLMLDGTDNLAARYLMNDASLKLGIPWVYGSAVGSFGMSAAFIPGQTACLRCVFESAPPSQESPTCDTLGVLASIVHIIASIQAASALKLLSGDSSVGNVMHHMDVWRRQYRTVDLSAARNPECEACARGIYAYLALKSGPIATTLCGRNAVQISWKEKRAIDLQELAAKLEGLGEVNLNEFLLRFTHAETTITVFRDGRAIVEGTHEPEDARALYARFIG